ncbi:hypothetical protein, partial [Chamaesiphon sp. VAR_48_metabat_135_sub]|uniref:hypothetical protein n=1 Tax=Chamaesiphon sp. VAR_48_metabat_135_sub TaxID=2964699 RepID=UPI00286B6CAE
GNPSKGEPQVEHLFKTAAFLCLGFPPNKKAAQCGRVPRPYNCDKTTTLAANKDRGRRERESLDIATIEYHQDD